MKRARRTHTATFAEGSPLALRLWLGVIVLLLVAAVVLARSQPQTMHAARAYANDVLSPVIYALQSPVRAFKNMGAWGRSFFTARSENSQLREELQQMQPWQAKAQALARENETLRQLLNVVPDAKSRFITARMFNTSDRYFSSNAMLAAGKIEGVRQRQAVVGRSGLIGVVAEVGQHTSRVLLLTDANARVAVLGETSGERAIAAGNGKSVNLLYARPNHNFVAGERLMTSGDGGFLPAGIAVARLDSLEELHALPFAEPRAETMVSVVDHVTENTTGAGF